MLDIKTKSIMQKFMKCNTCKKHLNTIAMWDLANNLTYACSSCKRKWK